VTLINGELEALILSRPDQYFWLHDRYRGAPAPLEPATCAPTDA
jgi:lauroyl/myristoyl acyltransferase